MSACLLAFDRVALVRGGRTLFAALDVTLGAGEALHLAGPNGSGKSSLLRLAAGLLRATAGRVEAATVALADEHHALDPELPLRRALALWGTGDTALAPLGLEALAEVPVAMLSSGQKKRATLARVAASGAQLWLLDEPLNALDDASIAALEALIVDHRAAGGAVVAASHGALGGAWARLELGR